MEKDKINDLADFCQELQADDLEAIDSQIKTLMIMRQMVPGAHNVRPEWAMLPVILVWSAADEEAAEKPIDQRRLNGQQMREQAVQNMLPRHPALGHKKQTMVCDKGVKRLRESVKPKKTIDPGCSQDLADINGNLFTPEERRVAIVKLLLKNGPMTPGAIAASLNMDVAKVYNVMCMEPGKSLFQNAEGGKDLTDKGRQYLQEGLTK